MKKSIVNILINSLAVFAICFTLLFLFQAYESYDFYSAYSKEDLAEFFSLKEEMLFIFYQSFTYSFFLTIVFVPVLTILEVILGKTKLFNSEKSKMSNVWKILIAIGIAVVASIIYVIANFSIQF
jgi:hypothetical protein